MPPTRRQLLVSGAALVASGTAGCSLLGRDDPPSQQPTRGSATAAREALRREAVARELSLLRAYADAMRTHPDLHAALLPLAQDHVAHLTALEPGAKAPELPPRPTATRAPGEAPAVTAVAALARLELAAATRHAAGAERASGELPCGRPLTATLASMAASESVHATVLGGVQEALPSPTPSPTETAEPTPTRSRSPRPRRTPSPTRSATPKPSRSATPSARPTRTSTPRPSSSPKPSPSPSGTP